MGNEVMISLQGQKVQAWSKMSVTTGGDRAFINEARIPTRRGRIGEFTQSSFGRSFVETRACGLDVRGNHFPSFWTELRSGRLEPTKRVGPLGQHAKSDVDDDGKRGKGIWVGGATIVMSHLIPLWSFVAFSSHSHAVIKLYPVLGLMVLSCVIAGASWFRL